MAKREVKRELWVVEERDDGSVRGAWFSKADARSQLSLSQCVTRYVPDKPKVKGWKGWIVLTESHDVVAVLIHYENAKTIASRPGDYILPVHVVPIESVKARKRKGGAK